MSVIESHVFAVNIPVIGAIWRHFFNEHLIHLDGVCSYIKIYQSGACTQKKLH